MIKRDPHGYENCWRQWKLRYVNGIDGITEHNSEMILTFLSDMELGKNTSPSARKGPRSFGRILRLRGTLLFFARAFPSKDFDKLTKDDLHRIAQDMRNGVVVKSNGEKYRNVSDFVLDFKAFWKWMMRTGRVSEDITNDLQSRKDKKPDWVYLTEDQFKTLANNAVGDYRALMWFMYDTGARVTEAYSIKVGDFSKDFSQLHIRDEYAKTFGRVIRLKLCSPLIREYVRFHNLLGDDFLVIKKAPAFNKYLRTQARRLFGKANSPARKAYDRMGIYDIRHNACCYWLKRYQKTRSLMYRMGWSQEKMVRYYSEFLGLADDISDEDMVVGEDKSAYEKEILLLKQEREQTNALLERLVHRVNWLQAQMNPRLQRARTGDQKAEQSLNVPTQDEGLAA